MANNMEFKIVPPNSIIFLFDRDVKNTVIPIYEPSNILGATENCISIGTLSEFDGETTVQLLGYCVNAKKKYPALHWFEPILLATPSASLSVVTAKNKTLGSMQTNSKCSAILIGVNDISEPDLIVICIT